MGNGRRGEAMDVVVFGASGRTGRLVVDRASSLGWRVTAVLRSPSPTPDGVRAIALGDVDMVETTLGRSDAVISALGPVAGVTQTEISSTSATIVGAMQRVGPRRLVVPANTTVLSDSPVTGPFANVADEHRRVLAIVRASGLEWTVIVAPILDDAAATGDVDTVIDAAAPGRLLTRGDLAATMVAAVGQVDWVGHLVGAANRV